MPLPDWCEVTAAQVITDSRLQAFMLQSDYNADDAEADADRLLLERAPLVASRLRRAAAPYSWPFTEEQWETAYPDEGSTERTARDTDQKVLATLVTKDLAVVALLRPLTDERSAKAAKEIGAGTEEVLAQLEADVRATARAIRDEGPSSGARGVIRTGRGSYESPVIAVNAEDYIGTP